MLLIELQGCVKPCHIHVLFSFCRNWTIYFQVGLVPVHYQHYQYQQALARMSLWQWWRWVSMKNKMTCSFLNSSLRFVNVPFICQCSLVMQFRNACDLCVFHIYFIKAKTEDKGCQTDIDMTMMIEWATSGAFVFRGCS